MIKQPKRSVQHKPTRDERKKNQDMQDLKAENRMLRKQMARLRKEALKPEVIKYETAIFIEPESNIVKCVKCAGIDLRSWTSPAGTIITTCAGCGVRTSVRKEE